MKYCIEIKALLLSHRYNAPRLFSIRSGKNNKEFYYIEYILNQDNEWESMVLPSTLKATVYTPASVLLYLQALNNP